MNDILVESELLENDGIIEGFSNVGLFYLDDIEICKLYQKGNDERDKYLKELLSRHNNLLRKLVWQFLKKNRHTGYDDFMQHARIGAIKSYNRFKAEKAIESGSKLSTYVYSTVSRYLMSMSDEDWFINCPPHRRSYRAYMNGNYTGVKLEDFERSHNLVDVTSKAEFKYKYKLLNLVHTPYYDTEGEINAEVLDVLNNRVVLEEEDIVLSMDINNILESLGSDYKDIYMKVMLESWKVPAFCLQYEVEEKDVRKKIRHLRRRLAELFET